MSTLVLCLHSSGSPASMWRSVARLPVLAGLEIVAPPLLGYGPNPPIPVGTTVTLDDEAAYLAGFIPAGVTRLHLVGHSYGGVMALWLARRLASIVASVWVYEPVIFSALRQDPIGDPAARAEADTLLATPEFRDPAHAGSDAWCRHFIDYWNRPGAFDRMPAEQRDGVRRAAGKIFAELNEIFFARSTFAEWRPDAPLTVAYGERTRITAAAMARALASVTPGATLDSVAGATHMAPLTDPVAVHPSIEGHFARVLAR
ncbi:MAG: alpha/beta hydrolase [Gemmatimonadetes bacterium]|nr:alpha/beta hydrolase [Gemmatimonadota bacterium]